MTSEAGQAVLAESRRVLLLGSSGRLGAAIAAALSACERITLIAPRRRELGLDSAQPHSCPATERAAGAAALDEAAAGWLTKWEPDLVINCIAMSDVDRCEREPEAAWQVNAELPGALGRAARAARMTRVARMARAPTVRIVHFSTDFVFDGTPGPASDAPSDGASRRPYRESDPPRPLSVYGASKLAGERAVADAACRHWIFRVSWLYGAPTGNLAARLLDPASAGQTIRLASNRGGVPNPVSLLAHEVAACLTAASEARIGVYHLSCRGATTWYEFGVEFVHQAIAAGCISPDRAPRLEAFDEATLSRPAQRPAWSSLDPRLYERSFGRTMPHWSDAIAAAQDSMCGRIPVPVKT